MGIYDDFPLLISSSLGSLESSLLKITAGASIANGGYRVDPRMIDVIYDKKGKLYSMGTQENVKSAKLISTITLLSRLDLPKIVNNTKKIISEETAYQMTSFLMGVIKRGTAKY